MTALKGIQYQKQVQKIDNYFQIIYYKARHAFQV